ncbi:MAG: hypothetical protein RLZZ488_977 [Pseudomonadota bacterium]
MYCRSKHVALCALILSALLNFSTAEAQWPSGGNTKSAPAAKPAEPVTQKQETTKSSTQTIRKVIRSNEKSLLEEMGTSLIFSADMGLITGFPSTQLANYGTKTGLAIEGKALGSVLLDNFILDAGLGWFFYSVSGDEPVFVDGSKIFDEAGQVVTDDTGIKLSGTIIEMSPSYRIRQNYFAGPTLQIRYPSDLGYDSLIARNALGLYFGAQGGYQMFDEDLNTRFVGRIMLPINYKDWLGLMFMAGVQIGLPFSQPDNLIVQESTIKTSEKRIVEYKKKVYKFKVVRDVIKLVLDDLVVFYPEPGFPTLTTESQSFLIDLSNSLSQTENEWGNLQVDTVTKDHGQVIRDALVSAGINDKKVKVGPALGGDKESATPPVEFTFKNVKQPQKLMDAVRQAMSSMSIPETCEGGECQ